MLKRPRSYGEDLDPDSDRPSSHRRVHSKPEGGRKGSSSSSHDRSLDDEREGSRSSRKRFDEKSEGFYRRKSSFDRYGDRSIPLSQSPRGMYGGERLRRSESVSLSRRDGGSSWRRSSSWKEGGSSSAMAGDSVGRGGGHHGISSDERGPVRGKDSPSGEQSRSEGTPKAVSSRKESTSSSEMEEGEIEPEDSEGCKEKGADSTTVSDSSSSEIKAEGGACEAEEEVKSSEMGLDGVTADDNLHSFQNESINGMNEPSEQGLLEGSGERNVEADECRGKSEIQEQEVKEAEEVPVVQEKVQGIALTVSRHAGDESDEKAGEGLGLEVEIEGKMKETSAIEHEGETREPNGIDLERAPEGDMELFDLEKEATLELMPVNPKEKQKDKGKNPAVSLSSTVNTVIDDDPMEGPSGRGFELVFPSDGRRPDGSNSGAVVIGRKNDEKPNLELLDLSLGLSNVLPDSALTRPRPSSPSHARSIHSLPSSFHTMSDGFTASVSFSGSQTFTHNPSCSLNQNSLENYEHSVGSRPLFQPVDQVPDGTVWHGQSSTDTKRKGGAGALFHRALLNGNVAHSSPHTVAGMHNLNLDGLARQSSLPRQISPSQSLGSRDTRSEHSKDRRLLSRQRSSSSLFRSDQNDSAQLVNVVGIAEVVTEPIQLIGRILEGMPKQSVTHLKGAICEMVSNADKHGKLQALQEALQKRSDLTLETLLKCNRILLEILVSLKTGLPDFIQRSGDVSSTDLAEIFLNLKCRNLNCRAILPVDECDCKVCVRKSGFCSQCMCLVCSKFDLASNTCSWVGCDVCLHWCHTDCALRDCYIRNGRTAATTQGMTEMQFHCVACDHPSEMFGFVKEVFKTCAKDWKLETLRKELQYVRRIFSASNDVRGLKLRDVADQMLVKLENKPNLFEVRTIIMAFFVESESNISSNSPSFPPKQPSLSNAEGSSDVACLNKEIPWLSSIPSDKVPQLETKAVLSSLDRNLLGRQTSNVVPPVNLEKKPVVDELESVVRFKQEEAKMYQERANNAKREAEALKHIAVAKNLKIEEDYANRIAKLRLAELEERRRQKFEEFQALERSKCEYFNMKTRMESDIKDLLLKMDAIKQNFN
ncbi:protein OBERON 4 [Dioscorea cayenensis subsp. rotundata]|uniref:Protein OBERON 4 n=1 Tax=Dioscorea cayennensis subsp. rotundata TaxID=55577 RepID=A0AB40CJK8_DIOCR|nr:protein OBERON 4 [Dioscorea cayenensis subsp. rotundata]